MARRLRQPPESVAVGDVEIFESCAAQRFGGARGVFGVRHAGALERGFDHRVESSRPARNSETCETQLGAVPLRMATSPLSGSTRPERISSSVDLPEPFGPIRPMRSPSETVNEIF